MAPRHILLVVIMNLVWGANFVFGKIAVDQIPPFFFSALRFAIVAALLFPFLKPAPGKGRAILMVAFNMGVVAFGLFFLGLKISASASSVALAIQIGPPLSVLLAFIVLGERVSGLRVFAIALAFVGVLVIGFDPVVFAHLAGLLVIVCSAFFYSIGTLVMRRLSGVGILQLQAWIAVLSGPPMLAISALVENDQLSRLMAAEPIAIVGLMSTAIGGSIFGFGGMYYLLQRYPIAHVMPLTLAAPVIGVVCGVIFLGDALSSRLVLGGAITLFGVALVHLRGARGLARTPRPAIEP